MEKAFISMKTDRVENVALSLTLDTRRTDEQLPVAVRVNSNRQTIYYRTGHRCTLAEWEKLCKATGKGKSATTEIYKTKLTQLSVYEKIVSAVKELQNAGTFTLDGLKEKITGKTAINFSGLWVEIAESKKIGTRDAYMIAYNSFTKYIGKNISFDRIGVPLIDKWKKGMEEDGLSGTTIGMYFRACRVIVNGGIKRGLIKPFQYPFGKDDIKIKKGRSRRDEYLSVAEILKLMTFVAPDNWRKGYREVVHEAIDLWMFSYLGNGMNLADMALLTWDKHYLQSGGTELCFIRKKTEDTSDEDIEIIVPIISELRSILDRRASEPQINERVFPFILNSITDPTQAKKAVTQWNSNIQDRVIAACKVLGIENKNVSMTWARHSFATNLTFAGVSERYISQAMGHSIKSVTQGYIGLFAPEKRMKFNQQLLEL